MDSYKLCALADLYRGDVDGSSETSSYPFSLVYVQLVPAPPPSEETYWGCVIVEQRNTNIYVYFYLIHCNNIFLVARSEHS